MEGEWNDEDYIDVVDSDHDDDEGGYTDDEFGGDMSLQPQVRWTQIRIGNTNVQVSTDGTYKFHVGLFQPSLTGIQVHGTPYRYMAVEGRRFYVHDVVWQAFYGAPGEGYEVRHRQEYVGLRARKIYSNKLANLEVARDIIESRVVEFGA